MPSALAKEMLERVEADPKVQILHKHTGAEAFRIAKHIFKADDAWAEQFTASKKSRSFGFLYSRHLRKNKILIYKLVIGDSVLGESLPYDKGYKLYNEAAGKN
jgi:hypothetical protein